MGQASELEKKTQHTSTHTTYDSTTYKDIFNNAALSENIKAYLGTKIDGLRSSTSYFTGPNTIWEYLVRQGSIYSLVVSTSTFTLVLRHLGKEVQATEHPEVLFLRRMGERITEERHMRGFVVLPRKLAGLFSRAAPCAR